jgi:hypothetical protein
VTENIECIDIVPPQDANIQIGSKVISGGHADRQTDKLAI